ncbi:MAG TPA: FAD-dependent oxidoreductase [Chloroflexota bacterium]|nr:FAD-dependent oxidoreductase [Chloroflexota bacterium]
MARTPLLRAIRRLAADHGVADQLGIEPAEVRAERRAARQRDGSLRRRKFLKLMAATGAATVLGGIRSAEGGGMAAPARIAIVGAGISGLTAALTLRDAGVDATVYEASGRVGGRISSLTNYWNEGQVSEWCGEQIDTNHEIVLGLASRFGLLVDDLIEAEPEGASETYFFQGGYYTEREADRDFGRVSKRLEADLEAAGDTTTYDKHTPAGIALDNMSVAEWIDLRVPNGRGSRFGKLLDIA